VIVCRSLWGGDAKAVPVGGVCSAGPVPSCPTWHGSLSTPFRSKIARHPLGWRRESGPVVAPVPLVACRQAVSAQFGGCVCVWGLLRNAHPLDKIFGDPCDSESAAFGCNQGSL
jgi:hypothetical protein